MSENPTDHTNQDTDQRAKLTKSEFIMEAREHASEQAEDTGHRWHLILQIPLLAIAVVSLGVGWVFHVNELFFVVGGTVIVMFASYVHARLFSGYYAIYCREFERAERLSARLQQRLFLHQVIDPDGNGLFSVFLENPAGGNTVFECRVQLNNGLIDLAPLFLHCSGEQKPKSATVTLNPGEKRKFDLFFIDKTEKTTRICAASHDDIFLTHQAVYELTVQAFGQHTPQTDAMVILLDVRDPNKPLFSLEKPRKSIN